MNRLLIALVPFLLVSCFKADPGDRKVGNPFNKIFAVDGQRKLGLEETAWLNKVCGFLSYKNMVFLDTTRNFLNHEHFYKHTEVDCDDSVERKDEDKLILREDKGVAFFERSDTNLRIFSDVVSNDHALMRDFCRVAASNDGGSMFNRYPESDEPAVSLVDVNGRDEDKYAVVITRWSLNTSTRKYAKTHDFILEVAKKKPVMGFLLSRSEAGPCKEDNRFKSSLKASYLRSN